MMKNEFHFIEPFLVLLSVYGFRIVAGDRNSRKSNALHAIYLCFHIVAFVFTGKCNIEMLISFWNSHEAKSFGRMLSCVEFTMNNLLLLTFYLTFWKHKKYCERALNGFTVFDKVFLATFGTPIDARYLRNLSLLVGYSTIACVLTLSVAFCLVWPTSSIFDTVLHIGRVFYYSAVPVHFYFYGFLYISLSYRLKSLQTESIDMLRNRRCTREELTAAQDTLLKVTEAIMGDIKAGYSIVISLLLG